MKFAASLLMVAVSFGAGMAFPKNSVAREAIEQQQTQATSGPYRDGLYLGKLAATQGDTPHASTGRWSRALDQQAFAAGYEQGYQDNK